MTQPNLPSSSRPLRTRQRVGKWLLAASVLASALAVGSLVTWTLCVVTAALATAVFLLWYGAEPTKARPAAGILVAVGLLLTLYTALQCVPMPVGLLSKIAPENADIWARALHPLGEAGPSWATISIEPLATRIQVLRGVAYLLAFVGALRIAQRREGTAFLLNLAIVCSVVMAVVALLHPAFGAQKVFWVYAPSDSNAIGTRHIAPLVNANHLAAYVNIGLCVALGCAIAPRAAASRVIYGAVFLVLVGVELWVASRGGFVGMALGILVTVVMSFAARRETSGAMLRVAAIGACMVAAVTMIVLASSAEAWEELADTDVSKLAMAKEGLRLVRLFPVFGAGRGAFETAFPAVRTMPGYIVFTHPENVVVQWVTEWGTLVSLLAAGAIAIALRPLSVLARSQPPVGAWAAIAAVTVHNLVDFSLEVPACVILLAVCAAAITGGSAGTRGSRWSTGWALHASRVAIAGGAAAAMAVVLASAGAAHELRDDRITLRDRATDGTPATQFHALARSMLLMHPGEAYLPLMGAVRAVRSRDESIMPWIGRTLERAPVYGPAHLFLAQSLYTRAPAQARLEYRLALEYDLLTGAAFQNEAPALVQKYDDAMELLPQGPTRAFAVVMLVDKLSARLPATAVRLDEELVRLSPDDVTVPRRAALQALDDLRMGDAAPWCSLDRQACVKRALDAASALRDRRPQACEGAIARADVFVENNDVRHALDELEVASMHAQDWDTCLRTLITMGLAAQDEARVSAALERLTRAGCSTDAECLSSLSYAAGIEIQRGNLRKAFGLYQMAYERNPDDQLLEAKAQLAGRIGFHAEALKDYMQLARNNPSDPKWEPQIRAEREAVSGALLQ